MKVLEEVVHESRDILKKNDSHQLVRQQRLEAVCFGFPSPPLVCCACACACACARASIRVFLVRSVKHKHTCVRVLGHAGDRQRRMHG